MATPEASITNCDQDRLMQSSFSVFNQLENCDFCAVFISYSNISTVSTELELLRILKQFFADYADDLTIAGITGTKHPDSILSSQFRLESFVVKS